MNIVDDINDRSTLLGTAFSVMFTYLGGISLSTGVYINDREVYTEVEGLDPSTLDAVDVPSYVVRYDDDDSEVFSYSVEDYREAIDNYSNKGSFPGFYEPWNADEFDKCTWDAVFTDAIHMLIWDETCERLGIPIEHT